MPRLPPVRRRADGGGVEADGVGDVVDFPRELESSEFAQFPALVDAGVDVEVAVAAEVVALPASPG